MTKHQRRMWHLLKINAQSLKGMGDWKGFWLSRWSHAFQHALVGPKTGCSCTYCFYSRRRYCPPGHPDHHVQIESRLRREFDDKLNRHITQIRIRDDQRGHPLG